MSTAPFTKRLEIWPNGQRWPWRRGFVGMAEFTQSGDETQYRFIEPPAEVVVGFRRWVRRWWQR